MAEALARQMFGRSVRIQSAGSAPTIVNPLAIAAMRELGVDMHEQHSKLVTELESESFDLVVTLCAEEVCPAAFDDAQKLHWPLQDPDRKHERLSQSERLHYFCVARDQISQRLQGLRSEHSP